jgi:hypothetical protein
MTNPNNNNVGCGVWLMVILVTLVFPSCVRNIMTNRQSSPNSVKESQNEYPCDYATGMDSAGRVCGGRSAEVIPGGRLGGTGEYIDPDGKPRVMGACNDAYDDLTYCP